MKITALSHRRKGLTALSLDGGEEILIDTELLGMYHLTVGAEIENIEKLLYESDLKRAKSRALWYLSRADRSKKALCDKLIRGGFSADVGAAAVSRMEELGLVDDLSYAKRLAEFLSASGVSNRELYAKMKLKGLPSDIIKEVLEQEASDETEKIKKLLSKKYSSKLGSEEGVQKVFAALIRKGFSYSDVRNSLREYTEQLDCEEF